jgi:hypothetical protein
VIVLGTERTLQAQFSGWAPRSQVALGNTPVPAVALPSAVPPTLRIHPRGRDAHALRPEQPLVSITVDPLSILPHRAPLRARLKRLRARERPLEAQPRQTRARERQSRVGMGERRALFATALARPLSRTVSLFARVALTPAAHASHVLVLVCHRNGLFQADLRESSRSRDAIASTRDVCATRQPNTPGPRLLP